MTSEKKKIIEDMRLALFHIRTADIFIWNHCHEECDELFAIYNKIEKKIKKIEGENNEEL